MLINLVYTTLPTFIYLGIIYIYITCILFLMESYHARWGPGQGHHFSIFGVCEFLGNQILTFHRTILF